MAIVGIPVLIMLTAFATYVGRLVQAEGDTRRAAYEAARAATLREDPHDAEQAARAVADSNLTASGRACDSGLSVNVDTTNLRPRGTVTVTITCTTSNSDIVGLTVPGSRTFTAAATSVVDTYRSDP